MDEKQLESLIRALDAPKWTELISTAVIVISAVVAAASLFYARWLLLADHKRSQRKTAVEMCIKWAEFTAPETSSVTRLIEGLTPQQADSVAKITKLEIDVSQRHNLLNVLQLHFPNIDDDLEQKLKKGNMYEIEGRHLQHIRHIALRYLNMLESILLSWADGLADHEAIVNEFSYLLDESQNRTAMEEFRRKVGLEAFPSIALFMTALRDGKAAARASVRRPSIVRKS